MVSRARPADDPVVFLRGVVTKIAANDYGAVWQTLHPAQQRVATRQVYVQCEQLSPIPGHLDSIRLVKAASERIAIAGDDGKVESEAATFRVTISEPALNDEVVVPMTVHAVAVKGQWRWILSPKRFELYRSKSCFGSAFRRVRARNRSGVAGSQHGQDASHIEGEIAPRA